MLSIVDKTGAEKVSYVYDAYGQIVSMTGDATLQKLNPCTYRGYYYDTETGLYYLQSRYYTPEWAGLSMRMLRKCSMFLKRIQ